MASFEGAPTVHIEGRESTFTSGSKKTELIQKDFFQFDPILGAFFCGISLKAASW